jgi:hypothetical protein
MAEAFPMRFWEKSDPIEGWLSKLEAILLYALCEGSWCEVGAWRGKSAVVLAETGHPGVVIDKEVTLELRNNLSPYAVKVVESSFEDAIGAVGQVQLLHLDADHSYEGTKRAYELYSPKVQHEGYLVFHDARGGGHPEVELFVTTLFRNPSWRHIASVERSVVFQLR